MGAGRMLQRRQALGPGRTGRIGSTFVHTLLQRRYELVVRRWFELALLPGVLLVSPRVNVVQLELRSVVALR